MNIKIPTPEELLQAGVHFGHQKKHWHPKMAEFIYTTHQKVHIIDLFKTYEQLEKAAKKAYSVAREGKKIIFVGTKPQSKDLVKEEALRCGALYVTERWIGGTLTNFDEIKRNRDKLVEYKKGLEEGKYKDLTKKERLMIKRKADKLEVAYGGLVGLTSLPGLLFVVDARRERTAVTEAKRLGIPVIALTDTNTDPTGIDYIIVGNDDAIKSVSIITKVIADAVLQGYKDFGSKGPVEEAPKPKSEEPAKKEDSKPEKKKATKKATKKVEKKATKATKKVAVKKSAKAKPKKASKPKAKASSKTTKAKKGASKTKKSTKK